MTGMPDLPEGDSSFMREPANTRPARDARFFQLLDKARDGDKCAVAELWNSYEFFFGRDEL